MVFTHTGAWIIPILYLTGFPTKGSPSLCPNQTAIGSSVTLTKISIGWAAVVPASYIQNACDTQNHQNHAYSKCDNLLTISQNNTVS